MTTNYNKVKNEGVEGFDEFFRKLPPLEVLEKEITYSVGSSEIQAYLSTFAERVHKATLEDKENEVEWIEVWQPVETGGEAVKADGTKLEKIAVIVNGRPILLKEGFCLDRKIASKEEADYIKTLTK